jgi:hypothetical protein
MAIREDCGVCCVKNWHGKNFENCGCTCHTLDPVIGDMFDPKSAVIKHNMDYFRSMLENPNLVSTLPRTESLFCPECMQEIKEEDLFHTCKKGNKK